MPLPAITLVLLISLPIFWICAEFSEHRWLRILLGVAAILLSLVVAATVGTLERLNYNSWYGNATKELLEVTIEELQAGNQTAVIEALSALKTQYHPTYENRANYDELVKQTVAQMKTTRDAEPASMVSE
jgi:hypothetical protein